MKEPTEAEILVRAKQLARDDGRHWLWSSTIASRLVDNVIDLRAEYLDRALELLRREKS
jgi:hypothetical protein